MIKSTVRSAAILKLASLGIACATIAFVSPASRAAMIASDNASNYSSGGWGVSASNLGSGFGPWVSYTTNNNGPPYSGTYLDSSSKNISTSSYSWGVYANTPTALSPSVDLVREFLPAAGGYSDPSTLGTLFNQTFSVAMQADGIGGSGSAQGFSLDTGQGAGATASPLLTLEYAGGGNNSMTLIDNDGTDNTNVPITFANLNAGLIVTVAVGGVPDGFNQYTLTISPAPGNLTFSTPYVFSNYTVGPIQQVDMFDRNTDSNNYFNSLAISAEVPEPATLSLLGIASLLLGVRRRKA